MQITGAELFVKALLKEGVDTIFAYPGGQVLDIFHELYGKQGLEVILPRHEQGLIHAADGYARSTGKVGVCLVTSGPGATNLVTGIATANYDSVPLVCFTGQVPLPLMGKDSFQEVDIVDITKSISKYAVTVTKREELAEIIQKAFVIARSGKPGVVVVDIPKDIQQALGTDEYPLQNETVTSACHYGTAGEKTVITEAIERTQKIIEKAQRPVFLVGGGVNIARAEKEMTLLTENTGIPVVTTIMGKGAIPTDHPFYIGNLGIHGSYAANMAVSKCDVLFAIGVRFNDRITGEVSTFASQAKIIHVDIEPSSISKNIRADIPIVAEAKEAIELFLKQEGHYDFSKWRSQIQRWEEEHPLKTWQQSACGVTPYAVVKKINEIFSDAVITTDVGQNQLWTTQYLELTEQKQLLTSGGFGTMGYGLPAAIGAKIGNRDRHVIAICGDGGIQMNIQELATAVVYELPMTICIFNNGYLGNVREWQELFFQKRYAGTCLRYRRSCDILCNTPSKSCPSYTPDFIRLAESYGAKGIRVTQHGQIETALKEAMYTQKIPTVIEFIIEREENVLPIVPPGKPISEMIFEI